MNISNQRSNGGTCFRHALNECLSHQHNILVHGYIPHPTLQNIMMLHAWVISKDGFVTDKLGDQIRRMPLDTYDGQPGNTRMNVVCYTRDFIHKKILTTDGNQTCGPWDERLVHDIVPVDFALLGLRLPHIPDEQIIALFPKRQMCTGFTKGGRPCQNTTRCQWHSTRITTNRGERKREQSRRTNGIILGLVNV